MSENQRIIAALGACILIYIGWQVIAIKTHPPKPAVPAAQPAAGPSGPATAPSKTAKKGTTPSPAAAPTAEAGSKAAAAGAPKRAAKPAAPVVPEQDRRFTTPLYAGVLSNRGSALRSFVLERYHERPKTPKPDEKREPVSLVTAEKNGKLYQARIDWQLGGAPQPPMQFVGKDPTALQLQGHAGAMQADVAVTKRENAYGLDYQLSVTNHGTKPTAAGATMVLALKVPKKPVKHHMFEPPPNLINGICTADGKSERRSQSQLKKDGPWTAKKPTQWVGIDRQYFVVAAIADAAPAMQSGQGAKARGDGCEIRVHDGNLEVLYKLAPTALAPGQSWQRTVHVFLGPKRTHDLEAIAPPLGDAVNFNIWHIPLGALARPMIFLLNVFHGWTASWGIAILLLTLVIKLVLFPVTYKSAVSMRKMQLLKPELDRIKKQFKDDAQRQQMEQLKLYKEKDVSLFGGCLPMLLQMPVWLALYRALWTAVDLYQQPFLWIKDLTAPEPGIPILALALGVLTYAQQLLTPMSAGADNKQMKMMRYIMPAFLTFVMWNLPSGLVLYVMVNSALSVLQQLVINKRTVQL